MEHVYEHSSAKVSNTQQAYQFLKKQILDCDITPGQEIYEKDLYNTLSWGRTPIHEALLLLRNDGLIEIFPRKGMRVTEYTTQMIDNIFQLRKLLEPSVATKYKLIYSKDILMDYYNKFMCASGLSDIEYYRLDIDFHRYLVQVTNNSILLKLWDEVMMHQYRLCLFTSKQNTSFRSNSDEQHARIINALLQENDEEIHAAVTEHLSRSLISAITAIRLQQ